MFRVKSERVAVWRRVAGNPAWRGWTTASVVSGAVVAASYVTTAVLTAMAEADAWPDAPGGLAQRVAILTGYGWCALLAVRLLRQLAAVGQPVMERRA